jgi:hypothetical protein
VEPLLLITSVPRIWLSDPLCSTQIRRNGYTHETTRQNRNPNKCQPRFNSLSRSHRPPIVIEYFKSSSALSYHTLIPAHPRSSPILPIYPILCLEQVCFLGWRFGLLFVCGFCCFFGGCCYWFGGGIHTSRFRKDARAICVLQIAGTRA